MPAFVSKAVSTASTEIIASRPTRSVYVVANPPGSGQTVYIQEEVVATATPASMFLNAFRVPGPSRGGGLRMFVFLWITFVTLFAAGSVNGARAHDGYDHYKNPVTGVSCCNRRDCRPLSANEVEARIREVATGVLVDGRLFPKDQLQEGPDGRWHVCEHPVEKTLFCVLIPRPSF